MKKLLFTLLILATWYLAAMYRLTSLMVLAAAELLLLPCMFALSRSFRRRLRVRLSGELLVLERNREARCPVAVENTGRFPSGRVRLRFRLAYWEGEEEQETFLEGDGAAKGESVWELALSPAWCGLLTVAPQSARVYDYLALFKAKIPLEGERRIAVLPAERRMHLSLSQQFRESFGFYEDGRPSLGSGSGDVRQLREYAAGDPYRLIHWNQTARMDALWVKEREPEQDASVPLYLELFSPGGQDARRLDAFFSVLYALTAGLLAEGLLVQAAWSGRQEGVALQSSGDCRALLLQLYQAFPWKGEKMPGGPGKGLFLDLDGRLFSNGREVCRFSAEEYRAELEETIVSL